MRPVTVRRDDASRPPRFPFVDGLRGLAALYVVAHHAALMVPAAGLSAPASFVRFVLRHGHYAVPVFIVLSGFSLMLSALSRPGGGAGDFLRRRARRILPPYYAALVLCLFLTASVPALRTPSRTPWDRALPSFGVSVVASHLVLLHNLDIRSIYRVAPPFWSLATEWQIYLLFPALLSVHRRLGVVPTVAAGFAAGAVVAALSWPLANPALRELCPWYAGLFALGMAGASRSSRDNGMSLTLGAVVLLASFGFLTVTLTKGDRYLLLTDVLAGAAATALLVRCTRASIRRASTPSSPPSPALRLLESSGVVRLGGFSYSLYLIHYPLLALANILLRDHGWSGDARLALLLTAVMPLCLVAASLFARLFERSGRIPHSGSHPGRTRLMIAELAAGHSR